MTDINEIADPGVLDLATIKIALKEAAHLGLSDAQGLLDRINAAGLERVALVSGQRVCFGIVPVAAPEDRVGAGRKRFVVEFVGDPRESWRRQAWYVASALQDHPWFKGRRVSTHHLSNIIAAARKRGS